LLGGPGGNMRLNTNYFILDASGKDDIKEYLDFQKNPSAQKNSRGYVYSANNQPEAVDGFCIGYYFRIEQKRITQLLDASSNWDKEVSK
jgi:penicillin amidase